MHANNAWWLMQLIESFKEPSRLYERFKGASEPDVEDLDKAMTIFEECCNAYQLKEIDFSEFIDIGHGLRSRQSAQKHSTGT